MSLSTHVLDTANGEPAAGVSVRLDRSEGADRWVLVALGRTDDDGRLRNWIPPRDWWPGRYRLLFDIAAYLGGDAFFPEVAITFRVDDPGRHLHVPLLVSPFGYSTYRGS